jgi:cytochrome bd-type quinol oxidase subunit 2
MREKAPAYRKERRERWELITRIVLQVGSFLIGLLGAATGLVLAIKK